MLNFFKTSVVHEIKMTAEGVKNKEGFKIRARIWRRIFPESFHWRLKDTKMITGYLNVKTSFQIR